LRACTSNSCGDLFQHELRIQPDGLALDALARLAEELHCLGFGELHPDLGDDAAPAALDDLDRVGSQKLVPCHLVDEHRHLVPLA